ncbi:hypothetical protein D0T84_10850 [Dysgonomonas sp. 521]|uniref:FISUMP domain-containing protein n=1 Tax=Dysgonomonas sp. 521 TaxID=2302932 RepID=UPI0013D1945D|nr:FISUMP domain-containing protein [Dysgonomonas sp. 521]NDV95409.1 hypothetical protein [Dysgonomonas sp. 521]
MKTTKTQNKRTGKIRWRQIASCIAYLIFSTGLQAQITIGNETEPQSYSALELISNGTTGMRLPHLITTERDDVVLTSDFGNSKTTLAKGLTIYNTTTNCLEYWNGTKWISQCEGETSVYSVDAKAKVESCIPYMFTYQIMDLTATYSGATPDSYQWVVNGKAVDGAISDTYAYSPEIIRPPLREDELGNNTATVHITCKMVVDDKYIQAADYKILVVEATKGKLFPIYVMTLNEAGDALEKTALAHVNLGDEYIVNPCELAGDLYQWGRWTDGHQKRNSESYPTNNASAEDGMATIGDLNSNGQIRFGTERYGKFIKSNTSPYDWRSPQLITLWGDGTHNYNQLRAIGDPCPRGWKVPSQKQWQSIYSNSSASGNPIDATVNKWAWIGTGKNKNNNNVRGFKINEALYLPAAGYRDDSDASISGEDYGYYWTSTVIDPSSIYSYGLSFISTKIYPLGQDMFRRAGGFSVRCIQGK